MSNSEKQIITDNRSFKIKSEQSAPNEPLISVHSSMNSSGLSTFTNTSTFSVDGAGVSAETNLERSFSKSTKKSSVKEAVIAEDEQGKKKMESGVCTSYLGKYF